MDLKKYQYEAYFALMRALECGAPPTSWETEETLSDIRGTLNIDDEAHQELRSKALSDPTVTAIKSGRMPSQRDTAISTTLFASIGGSTTPTQPMARSQPQPIQRGQPVMQTGYRGPPTMPQVHPTVLTGGPTMYLPNGAPAMTGPPNGYGAMGLLDSNPPSHPQHRSNNSQHPQMMQKQQHLQNPVQHSQVPPMRHKQQPRKGFQRGGSQMGLDVIATNGGVGGTGRGAPALLQHSTAHKNGSNAFIGRRPASIEGNARETSMSNSGPKAIQKKSKTQELQQLAAAAYPPGLDLNNDNMQGMVVERYWGHDGWCRGIIAHSKRSTQQQTHHLLYDIDTPNPSWELSCTFYKNQAGKTWRIPQPVEIIKRDWDNYRPPEQSRKTGSSAMNKKRKTSHAAPAATSALLSQSSGVDFSMAPLSRGVSSALMAQIAPAATSLPDDDFAVAFGKAQVLPEVQTNGYEHPPYSSMQLNTAIERSEKTGNPSQLQKMVHSIQKRRASVIKDLAQEHLADQLDHEGADVVLQQLKQQLQECRAQQHRVVRELSNLDNDEQSSLAGNPRPYALASSTPALAIQ